MQHTLHWDGSWAGDIAKATLPDSVLFDYVRVYRERPST